MLNAAMKIVERVTLALKHIIGRAGFHPIDEVSVDLGIDGGQGYPADVMQNAGGVGEIAVD